MTIQEKISVMQAFADGKKIEFLSLPDDGWQEVSSPSWNWGKILYRVKPEPKLRPYKNAEEFFEAQQKHGLYLHDKKDKTIGFFPFRVDRDCVACIKGSGSIYAIDYDILLKDYQWRDGSPCGILE